MKIKLLNDGGYGKVCAAGDILEAHPQGRGVDAYVPAQGDYLYFSACEKEYVVLDECNGWGLKDKETGELMQGAVATREIARSMKSNKQKVVRVIIKEA